MYFAMYFTEIRSFLNKLDADEAQSIQNAKVAISTASIRTDLAFIKSMITLNVY